MITRSNLYPARISLILTAVAILAIAVRAGNLDSPISATSPDSAMFTLQDIYDKLDVQGNVVAKRTGAFADPGGGPTNRAMHTLNEIMALVTNRAPVMKTGETKTCAANDDGALKLGVAWPTNRFVILSDTNCVVDNLTGLMWARNAGMFATTNWGAAVTNCNDLVYGGYDDWRLPNVREFLSLMSFYDYYPTLPYGHPFVNVRTENYWTSTTCCYTATRAFFYHVATGRLLHDQKTQMLRAWPVRGGY